MGIDRMTNNLLLAGALAVSLSACGVDEKAYAHSVYINEIQSTNQTTLPNEEGKFPDWLELYNAGDEAVDLSGYSVGDAKGKQVLGAGVTVGAKGVVLLWADDADYPGPTHLGFKFSSSGDSVTLTDPNGQVLDTYTFGELETDSSFARFPDGTGEFIECMYPTPEALNGDSCQAPK